MSHSESRCDTKELLNMATVLSFFVKWAHSGGIDTIATIDRDFDIYRLKSKKPFTVLIK